MKTGIDYISAERERQVNEEGWTQEHDSEHVNGELAGAASCYALPPHIRNDGFIQQNEVGLYDKRKPIVPADWPWHPSWWKPTPDNRIHELSKAGALIAAEIDRLLALKQQDNDPRPHR